MYLQLIDSRMDNYKLALFRNFVFAARCRAWRASSRVSNSDDLARRPRRQPVRATEYIRICMLNLQAARAGAPPPTRWPSAARKRAMALRATRPAEITHAIPSTGRTLPATAMGRAMPVPAATHAAMQSGHFGSRNSAAPGSTRPAAPKNRVMTRRARGRLRPPPLQHGPLITSLPCAHGRIPSRAAACTPPWGRACNRPRTCRGAAPTPC